MLGSDYHKLHGNEMHGRWPPWADGRCLKWFNVTGKGISDNQHGDAGDKSRQVRSTGSAGVQGGPHLPTSKIPLMMDFRNCTLQERSAQNMKHAVIFCIHAQGRSSPNLLCSSERRFIVTHLCFRLDCSGGHLVNGYSERGRVL